MLQWSPAGVEGVADIIAEEAAQGGHVDVSKARQTPQEVCRVLVSAEQAAELGIEETLGHFSAGARAEG